MTREEICNSMTVQDAVQVLKETNCYGTMDIAKTVIIKALETQPKSEQQPKTGYWISLDTGKPSPLKNGIATESVKCSECDEWLTASDEYATYGIYCPKCGSYNGGGTKRIDKHKTESEDKE